MNTENKSKRKFEVKSFLPSKITSVICPKAISDKAKEFDVDMAEITADLIFHQERLMMGIYQGYIG